jgi:hypothetical protein
MGGCRKSLKGIDTRLTATLADFFANFDLCLVI